MPNEQPGALEPQPLFPREFPNLVLDLLEFTGDILLGEAPANTFREVTFTIH